MLTLTEMEALEMELPEMIGIVESVLLQLKNMQEQAELLLDLLKCTEGETE